MIRVLIEYLVIRFSGCFDSEYYLENNPDVRKARINPLIHFIKHGWREGRNPSGSFNTKGYINQHPELDPINENPLFHFIRTKSKRNTTMEKKKSKQGKRVASVELLGKEGKKIEKSNPKSQNKNHVSRNQKNSGKENQRITLFLHIGEPKTGTTAIQNFLDVNRLRLFSEHGILYPNFSSEDLISGKCINHHYWFKSSVNNKQKLYSDLKKMLIYSQKHAITKVILSNEAWFISKDIIDDILKVTENFANVQLKPIIYLRRVDQYVQSSWKQFGIITHESIAAYYDQPRFMNQYKNVLIYLEFLSEIIDKANIIIQPYEKQQLPHGLLHDFLAIVGINYSAHNWSKVKNTQKAANLGFNRDVLEMLHISRELHTHVRLFQLFTDLLGEEFQKEPFEPYDLLSPVQRIALLESNQPYEKIIAEKFMDRKEGKIFFDPIPSPEDPWQPSDEFTIESALPILIKMINSSYSQLLTLKNRVEKLEQSKRRRSVN